MNRTVKVVAALALSPFLMAQNGGCDTTQIPTVEQIELYIPMEMRSCPYAPKSPGRNASKQARAVYIQGLYYAWKRCYDDNKSIDRLYQQYQDRLHAAARSGSER